MLHRSLCLAALLAGALVPGLAPAYQCARGQEWYFALLVLGAGDSFGAVGHLQARLS